MATVQGLLPVMQVLLQQSGRLPLQFSKFSVKGVVEVTTTTSHKVAALLALDQRELSEAAQTART